MGRVAALSHKGRKRTKNEDSILTARLKGVKPGTVNRSLAVVRRILNLAARVWRDEHTNAEAGKCTGKSTSYCSCSYASRSGHDRSCGDEGAEARDCERTDPH